MKTIITGYVALALILMIQTTGYTSDNLNISNAKSYISEEHIDIEKASKKYTNYKKPIDLFISLDINQNKTLESSEIEQLEKEQGISDLMMKDSNKDGLISMNEFFDNEEKELTSESKSGMLNNYTAISGIFLLVVLAGIKIKNNS